MEPSSASAKVNALDCPAKGWLPTDVSIAGYMGRIDLETYPRAKTIQTTNTD